MSTERKDGGPAFPQAFGNEHDDYPPGMSLRDWFAGMALAAKITDTETFNDRARKDGFRLITKQDTAKACYMYADAMLEARKQ